MADKAQIIGRTYNILDRFIAEQPMNSDAPVYSNLQPSTPSGFLTNTVSVDAIDVLPGLAINTGIFQISIDGGITFGANSPDFNDGLRAAAASMTGVDLSKTTETIFIGSITLPNSLTNNKLKVFVSDFDGNIVEQVFTIAIDFTGRVVELVESETFQDVFNQVQPDSIKLRTEC